MIPSRRIAVVCLLTFVLTAAALPAETGRPQGGAAAQAESAIHAAARAGDLAKLKSLLAADAGLVGSRDLKGMTPLHIAAQEKHPEAVGLLLAAGADVKAVDADKYTPLHRAAFAGDAESCRLLLEAGADPKAVEAMGRTPLMLACGFGKNLEAVKRLVAGGSDLNYTDPGGDNVLLGAMMFGQPEIVDFLLQSGAKLAGDGRSIWMGLMVSTRFGHETVFRQALQAAERNGMTLSRIVSLHDAAGGGSVPIGEILLAKGFEVDKKNAYGGTAMQAAAEGGRTAFVAFLLERGAKIDERDRMGRTAWHLARENKHAETADLLKARGASTAEPEFPELRGDWLGQPEPDDTPGPFRPRPRLGGRRRKRAQPRRVHSGHERSLLDQAVSRPVVVLQAGERAVDAARARGVHVPVGGRRAVHHTRRQAALLPELSPARAGGADRQGERLVRRARGRRLGRAQTGSGGRQRLRSSLAVLGRGRRHAVFLVRRGGRKRRP